jgi:TolB-like protein/class 3 adenylate cyclase/Tfp pilus assembly protein PilF
MASDAKKEIQLEIGHVLFIDIVAYSKLSLNQQRAAIEQLNEIVKSSAQFQKSEEDGQLLKLAAGDGVALVFTASPQAPAQCAVEITRSLKSRPHLVVRMGLHSGPVNALLDVGGNSNVAGAGINMAQRVMSCGDAGHILLSRRAAEDLVEFEGWRPRLHELGTVAVKHGARIELVNLHDDEIGNPAVPAKMRALQWDRWRLRMGLTVLVLLIAVAVVGGLLLYRPGKSITTEEIPQKSIAVMPFENRSGDNANAYFADGIQDEILTRLSKIADLKVISRTSTQHYKSAPENLPEIARQLGVAHIVEGSVQKSGDTVRVNVQLIKAANDSHLWADTFDRKVTDIFVVESEVAKTIADHLKARLTGQEEQVIAAKSTDNPEAYDDYLRGLAYLSRTARSSANDVAAQKYLREAVRLDPKFALAWSLLSYVDAAGYVSLSLQPTAALREEARDAAETALKLQPNLGEALRAQGYYYYACLKNYDTAARYFEQARQVLPNNSRIFESLGYLERRRGQWERSEAYLNEAERLDPRNAALLTQTALNFIAQRRCREAVRKLDQALDVTPDDPYPVAVKASAAQMQGDLARAAALLAPLHPNADSTQILETQAYQGILDRHPGAIIARLREVLSNPDRSLGYNIGGLFFYLGWLEEVAGDRNAAEQSWRQARDELQPLQKEQPENYLLLAALTFSDAKLGNKEGAVKMVREAMRADAVSKDALAGPRLLEIDARLMALSGNADEAIPSIGKLLRIPYSGLLERQVPLTSEILRLDPMFDAIRNDPRFQKLLVQSNK